MTREQSGIIKGVAILVMLFYHLFNVPQNLINCKPLLWVDGVPFVELIAQISNPVALFLLVGGYGMYKVYEKGDSHRYSRIFKLYIAYWLTLIAFLPIAHFLNPHVYPCTFKDLFINFTAFHTTYNREMWFLFPYVIVAFLSRYIFKFLNRFAISTVVFCLVACFVIYMMVIIPIASSNSKIYFVCFRASIILNFILGGMMARANFFERINSKISSTFGSHTTNRNVCLLLLILCLAFTYYFLKYNFFYPLLLIVCINAIIMPQYIAKVLESFGKHSMSMWMIHSWYCYYICKNFIYGFKYPIIIFIVLVVMSYFTALIIDCFLKHIYNSLKLNKPKIQL